MWLLSPGKPSELENSQGEHGFSSLLIPREAAQSCVLKPNGQKPYLSPFLERGHSAWFLLVTCGLPRLYALSCLPSIVLNAVTELTLSSVLMGLTWSLYVPKSFRTFACHVAFGELRTKWCGCYRKLLRCLLWARESNFYSFICSFDT